MRYVNLRFIYLLTKFAVNNNLM